MADPLESDLTARYSHNLSKNLVNLRKARNLTQHDLASICQIPRSTIHHMETGASNPSLSNLIKLSHALGVSLEELLSRPKVEVQLIASSELPKASKGRGGVLVFDLLPHPVPGVELERLEMPAKSYFTGTPHLKGAKEYFCCVKGEALVRVLGERYIVRTGDVLVFPGDERHSYHNEGQQSLIGVSVILWHTISPNKGRSDGSR